MKHRVAVALFFLWPAAGVARAQVRAGGEFRVNTYTTSFQDSAHVASDAVGNFVVAWRSYLQDGSHSGVFAQRYDSSGMPLGSEFQVNTYTSGQQYRPAVAVDATGKFLVAWASQDQDGSGFGVFGQRFDASGARLGGEFQVNTYTTAWQSTPAVAADQAGHFVVVWESYFQEAVVDVFGQRFDATGARLGAEFQVNSYTTGYQNDAAVASSASGSFVVVWTSVGPDGSGAGIAGQRFDASGARQGGEFQVNTYTTGWQIWPAVGSDAAGNFVVA
jgi:hypothetical protein